MEIKGKFATAISYAKEIEPVAEEQIRTMCDQEFTQGCRVRIMPDVHAGKGCTIGTIARTTWRAGRNGAENKGGTDMRSGRIYTGMTAFMLTVVLLGFLLCPANAIGQLGNTRAAAVRLDAVP